LTVPDATVVIVTRDRRDLLAEALELVLGQAAQLEVVVLDDGSTDGTSDMLRRRFPRVRAERSATPRGPAAGRNEAIALARAPVVVSLDDDMLARDPGAIAHALGELDHPSVGAVAMPYVEAHDPARVRQLAPAGGPWATFRFGAGAHAIRRSVFLALGGYWTALRMQGEESDLCLRMLAAGHAVRLGAGAPMLHLSAPPYDTRWLAFLGRRNDVLYAWRNVPARYLPARAAKILARTVVVGAELRQPVAALHGMLRGVRDAPTTPPGRDPVPASTYRLAHALKARGALPLADVAASLTPRRQPT
jgi:glycosyltransferase involved in cell wall biosynthesis